MVSSDGGKGKGDGFFQILSADGTKAADQKDDAAKYKTAADLKGAVIGAEKSTTQEAAAQKVEGAKSVGLTSVPDAVLELKHGKLNGIIIEGIVARQYLIFNPDLVLADVTFPDAKKLSAVALQKEMMTWLN